ncbi:MAG: iron chelate uptake ABC transporter family permease subunit [bacterium]|nr:iron chelate uptake ABC transporter family permease subunit [bacterium]
MSLVSKSDVNLIIVLATVILLVLFFIKDSLIKVTYDEDNAEASGVNTKLINLIFIILVSMLITLAIPITGILLLSVLIILPVIVSTQISWSFKSTIVIAEIISILSVIS